MQQSTASHSHVAILRPLLEGFIDYAGLFPPSNHAIEQVVHQYGSYRSGGDAWALGRLVVPANRLSELSRVLPRNTGVDSASWDLTVLLGPEPEKDLAAVDNILPSMNNQCRVDCYEVRIAKPADAQHLAKIISPGIPVYCEVVPDPRIAEMICAVNAAGLRAKIRMGGVKPEMFPPPGAVISFLSAAISAPVMFKATAGLHHPMRAEYPLTYEPHSRKAPMYGFLNLLFAAAAVAVDAGPAVCEAILVEFKPSAFRFDGNTVQWNELTFSPQALHRTRELFRGIGSCSFTEPMNDLRALGLLS